MIHKLKNKRGFSLIEIILAVSIFALSVMGLTGSLIYGQQSSLLALHRAQAVFLANEGLEATENIGRESFSNLVDGTFGLAVLNNSYILNGSFDMWDIYKRKVTVSNIDNNTKQVESDVSWSLNTIDGGQVSLITYITNWQ
jgi:prepilin-type N-terminal cleavage/methylation domain-containing protein